MKKTKQGSARRGKAQPPHKLISHLEGVEASLQRWINSSPENALFFRSDPIAAMRAAGLEIDDDIMLEIELITRDIARKLK
ncbi:MAG TPA: hypothetical protein VFP59_13810 [Candidatus Angelobacter sp.]|nr:hypothetical protein [Candidatus Angelobacter sp.]